MKTNHRYKRFIFPILMLVLLMNNSCTIEKRLYNKGYYVSWNKHYRSANEESQPELDKSSKQEHRELPETMEISETTPVDGNSENGRVLTLPESDKQVVSRDFKKNQTKQTEKQITKVPEKIVKKLIPEKAVRKWAEAKEKSAPNLISNIAGIYLIVALGCALLGLLFLYLGLISPPILDAIFFVLSGVLFVCVIVLLIMAMILWLINSNVKKVRD